MELAMYLDERAKVGLTIPFGSNTLRPKAEMLFPMRAVHSFLQPFPRFLRRTIQVIIGDIRWGVAGKSI